MAPREAEFVRLGADLPAGGQPKPSQVVLIAGDQVPLLSLDMPDTLRGAAREAVARRMVQDLLGGAPGAIEMRPFQTKGSAQWHRVLVADSADVATWCTGAGPGCKAVLPDYLALPTAEGLWVVAGSDNRISARLGPADGFTAAPPVALALLEKALAAAPDDPPKALFMPGAALPDVARLAAAHDIALATTAEELTALGLPRPVVLGHGELDCDLRRDPQAAQSKLARQVLPWRWPVLVGALAVGLWASADLVMTRHFEAQTAALQAETLALTRQHFVPNGPILDVRQQIATALATARAASDTPGPQNAPLDLMAEVAQVIVAEGAGVQELSLSAEAGLRLTLRTTTFAEAEQVTDALRARGATVVALQSRTGRSTSEILTDLAVTDPTAAEATQ